MYVYIFYVLCQRNCNFQTFCSLKNHDFKHYILYILCSPSSFGSLSPGRLYKVYVESDFFFFCEFNTIISLQHNEFNNNITYELYIVNTYINILYYETVLYYLQMLK